MWKGNPAQNYTALSFELSDNTASGMVTVSDATGRILTSQQLTGPVGQMLLDTRSWDTGMYTVACIVEGRVVQTEKLIVP